MLWRLLDTEKTGGTESCCGDWHTQRKQGALRVVVETGRQMTNHNIHFQPFSCFTCDFAARQPALVMENNVCLVMQLTPLCPLL